MRFELCLPGTLVCDIHSQRVGIPLMVILESMDIVKDTDASERSVPNVVAKVKAFHNAYVQLDTGFLGTE